jgi:hypothetical protein
MIFKYKLYCRSCDGMTDFGDSWDNECWRCENCGTLPCRKIDFDKLSEDEDDYI